MADKKIIELRRSNYAESFLHLDGNLLSLDDYKHMRAIYNDASNDIVLKFSRQTAKSTTLANIMVANSALIPYFRTLYVAPTVDQTKVFSRDRVAPVLEGSPLIKENYMNSSLVQNVFMKQLLNGSRMYLRYALLSADHLRGYSSDFNLFDESQDLKADIIPVVQETMSRSLYKRSLYSGTPKRTKGTLADLWFASTQNEYMLKCPHCNTWNLLGADNIGPESLICNNSKCERELDPREAEGEWVSTFSNPKEKPLVEGYRVCLLHFAKAPWVSWEKDVIGKQKLYSKAAFFNEVLALEYDHGVAPITRSEVMAACSQTKRIQEEPSALEKSYQSIMGIDYGPVNSTNSYTVISVIQLRGDNKFHVVYAKRFTGKEADYGFIHKEIPRLMNVWSCDVLAADYGMGEAPNGEIQGRIGKKAVIAFQHNAAQKEKARWNNKMPAYTLNRNQTMNEVFNLIKTQKLVFPKWIDSQTFLEDILNIQTEYNEELGKSKYINVGPDDFFHATLFAVLSAQLMFGTP